MTKKLEFFYSYALEDNDFLVLLQKRLLALKYDYPPPILISVWYDQMIEPGKDREQAIKDHLDSANLFLLLVSPDFIAADQCEKEMQHALKRYAQKNASVVPVYLRPTYLGHLNNAPFAHIQ